MGRCLFARSIATVAVFAFVVLALGATGQTANAKPQNPDGNDCWIDAATGAPVPTIPAGTPVGGQLQMISDGRGTLANGKNVYRDPSTGNWNDAATGAPVSTIPAGTPVGGQLQMISDGRGTLANGKNVARVPCPPPQTAASTGLYLGGEVAKNWGWVRSTERLSATDLITNQFTDSADPFGGGFVVGYNFTPWRNILIGPFGSFDFMRAPVNHTFAGGSYLGTTANFMGTFGVKGGATFNPGLWVYGIAGVSVLNQSLNINFIPVSSSSNSTVPGATIGAGVAWQPSVLQGFGRPVSIFLEYEHTWWQSANFNAPTASPLFNYNFARQDDLLKLGFTVLLGDPRSALPPPIINK